MGNTRGRQRRETLKGSERNTQGVGEKHSRGRRETLKVSERNTQGGGEKHSRGRRETLKGAERNIVGVQQNPGGKGVQKHLSAATVYTRGRG